MRPVLLEMNGFASFREPTTVDFRDADYFALVGATGSGKSTIIDALTFALYGTVARWDDRRAVALALAPTAGRGAVRFVFDVGDARHVVARELRRAASGGVSVRTARLERLLQPDGMGGPDEETVPLADGAGAVTRAVEELLGLGFGDFTSCVVLPQGAFAEFLHTEPRKRQEKLVRLLGIGVYDTIAREANAEAAQQRVRAETMAGQLGSYADATEDAEQAAAARVAALDGLAERVRSAAGELGTAAGELAAVRAEFARLDGDRARLAALAAPSGLAELTAASSAAGAALAEARARMAAAEDADVAARDALAAAPARGPLEGFRRAHAERGALVAEAPGAGERADKARAAYGVAEVDAADARAALDTARAAASAARTDAAKADAGVTRLAGEIELLRGVAPPAGLDALASRQQAAAADVERAVAALRTAEDTEAAARDELAAPERGPLEQARRDHADLTRAAAEQVLADERVRAAAADTVAAEAAVTDARARVEHAREAEQGRLRDGLAAELRATLVAGDDCPVCAQAVAAPPPALPVPAADDGLARAEAALEAARASVASAAAAEARASGAAERVGAQVARLRHAIGELGSADVDAALADLDRRAAAADRASAAVRAARRAHTAAVAGADGVRADLAAAGAALRAARDPLVGLGAPAAGDDVVAAWAALGTWASTAAAAGDAELGAARAAAASAGESLRAADAEQAAAGRVDAARRSGATDAARAEADARAAVERIIARTAELDAELAGAPSAGEVDTRLAELAALDAAAARAADALRTARTAERAAAGEADVVQRRVGAAQEELRAARDPVVGLGAPVPGGDLAADWAALVAWAAGALAAGEAALAATRERGVGVRAARDALAQRTAADLAEHGVEVTGPGADGLAAALVDTAPSAVAAAGAGARADRDRIAERRAAAVDLLAAKDAAEESAQVAALLGRLLRSDGFPRWLVASALDALVVDASRSLAELSGGQFELTHENGDFLVVDHADADARRPVKTLSGGETFQASLALALALSAQMADLAAAGAARLESIVLDEGFGTLDEANLEVVASTLENLAARGDRVVGVITHVAALAERVPVRFAVRRDQRTSSVEREGLS